MTGEPRAGHWPPRSPCFAPRLAEYLAYLEQRPLAWLLSSPGALAGALRRASLLFELEVECLEVPVWWVLHAAGWSAEVGPRSVQLGLPPSSPRRALEVPRGGALPSVLEALRALGAARQATSPATLVSLPSPAALAASAGDGEWALSALQALVRALGELEVLSGIMFLGPPAGLDTLGRLLAHYQLSLVRLPSAKEAQPAPGTVVARPVSLTDEPGLREALRGESQDALLLTTETVVPWGSEPEALIKASRICREAGRASR